MFRSSGETLMDLRRQALVAKARLDGKLEEIGDKTNFAIEVAEVVASSWFFGALNGYQGGKGAVIWKVPVDLAAAVLFGGYAFLNIGKKSGDHAKAVAFGALGSYFSTRGAVTGNAVRLKGGNPVAGLLGSMFGDQTTGGGSLADEALANMVRPAA